MSSSSIRPVITTFADAPDRGRGLARDMPVRWALEEVGWAYQVQEVTFDAMRQPAHRSLQPFGQIPTFECGNLRLFESGAIVLHIARCRPGLLPDDADARARAVACMFAAVSSVEPVIVERETAGFTERDRPWFAERLALVEGRVSRRLAALSAWLGDSAWLDGAFSAGDLLMIQVLRRLSGSGLLEAHDNLIRYVARGEARPAFQRAFQAQRAAFERRVDRSPPGARDG